MPKEGDHAVMYCGKCKLETPHTYKSKTSGDVANKIFGFKDMGSGWYCDNCGKRNTPRDYNDIDIEDIIDEEIGEEY